MSRTRPPRPPDSRRGGARTQEVLGPARDRPGRPDPGRPRHLGGQHRPPDHRTLPAPRRQQARQWLVTAYVMMSGAGLLSEDASPTCCHDEGVFLTGLALFTVASLVSGLADSGGR